MQALDTLLLAERERLPSQNTAVWIFLPVSRRGAQLNEKPPFGTPTFFGRKGRENKGRTTVNSTVVLARAARRRFLRSIGCCFVFKILILLRTPTITYPVFISLRTKKKKKKSLLGCFAKTINPEECQVELKVLKRPTKEELKSMQQRRLTYKTTLSASHKKKQQQFKPPCRLTKRVP